jgi:hypothetical protein
MNTKLGKGLLCFLLLGVCSSYVQAQDDVNDLLNESIDDSKKLIHAYVSPLMNSLSSGLNQGWYNTAKTHKIAGVDLTITVNAMGIPSNQLTYNPSKLGLQRVSLDNSSPGYPNAPTVFGKEQTPKYIFDKGGVDEPFDGPPGIDLKGNIGMNRIPVPMAHLGIGLPKGTDLKIRFVPAISIGDGGEIKMFGVGVMHDVKQWIPGIKRLPFDLSGFVGYSKLSLSYAFDDADASAGENNQRGEFNVNATTIQGVISKKISVITFYGGVGYNIAKSNLAVKGTFDLNDDNDTDDANEKNPLDLKFAASGPRATAGFRLKLAVFTLHADYTLQKYSCISAGFGIAVR